MVHCRLGYLAALAGAVAFFLCFNGYLSFYILVLALVFPLLSLLVSLPGMLGVRAGLAAPESAARRHGQAGCELRVMSRTGLSVARLAASFTCRNLLTGEERRFRKRLTGCGEASVPVELAARHCGRLDCTLTKLKVYDLLGLFSIRRPLPDAASVLVLPLKLESEREVADLGAEDRNAVLRPRPGGGPGEDYDLRAYRPGDPLRSVHWKLSSKVDDLIVRETLESVKSAVVLTYDHFGSPDELDAVFDRLDAVSRALTEQEIPHYIQWTDPGGARLRCRPVNSVRDLRAFQWEAFALPAPPTGQSLRSAAVEVEGISGPVRHLHVTAKGGEGGTAT